MEIPENLSMGETHYFLQPSNNECVVGENFFVEGCYLFRLGKDDRRNLSKRMDEVYDYVAHWDVCRGTPNSPKGFPETVIQDAYQLNDVKQYLLQLNEPHRARETFEINLSMDPATEMDGIRLHASQNIHEKDI